MFNGDIILKRINHKIYEMVSLLEYKNSNISITIFPGFRTDGASIPRILWTLIGHPLGGKYIGSAVIHDGLYASQLTSRNEADKLFLEMLEHNKVGYVKRHLMYYGVKFFGNNKWVNVSSEIINKSRKLVYVSRR